MRGCSMAARRRLCWWLAWASVVLLQLLGIAAPDAPPFPFAFTRHTYNTTIPENSVGKTYVMSEEKMGIFISDPTLDVKYKINSGDNDKYFKADARLVGDFWFLLIRTRTGHPNVLNRERQEVYNLQVRATVKSRGRQRVNLRAKTEVRVQVLDTNDLNPLFYPTEYDVVVPEDTPLHRSIAQVSASDADIGINGEVYYSFLEYVEQFTVHPTTGIVSLTRPLSFHERSVHQLTVVAQDRGTKRGRVISPSSRARLRVTVQQVNLHDPHIFVRHLPSVVEDTNVDIYAIVKVTDEDEGAHGQIARLEILAGDPNGHFRVQPGSQTNEYNIVVLSFLDRELAPDGYNLTLRATDRGTPQRSTTKVVRVRLTDLNDHAPQFMQKEYHVVLEEVSPVNTPVVRVRAHDTDAGRNAEVVYEIVEGNDDRTFGINPATGLVVTARALDAEEQASYRLKVMAVDQGNNGMRKSSTTEITVIVQDNNDQDPMFVKSSTEVVIDENEQANTVVFRATAVDSDQGENGYVSYSIANLSPTPFTIDHFTGEIRTKEVLDYETMRRNYLLKVRASDWGTPFRRQAEMTLRITLRDVNDNRPQFEKVDCAGVLFRKTPIRSEILTLSAIDFDSGNIITYRIVSGNEDRCFELDPTSGVITLACSLEDVKTRERYLNVTATDGLNFADTMSIRITLVNSNRNLQGGTGYANFECREVGVTQQLKELIALSDKNNQQNSEVLPQMPTRFGVNKHSPEFDESFPARVEVNESIPIGSEIALLKAVDKDLGYNGQVVYVISHGDEDSCFQVDMYGGILSVVAPLDRERRASYKLNVTAYDLGRQQRSTSKIIEVEVLDVNDNPPIFNKASHSVTLPENVAIGTVVVNLTATDRDIGPNAVITYSIISDVRNFAVDPSSGVVTVRESLDREQQSEYELKIRATDGGGDRSLSSTAIVRVKVLDVNDNPPAFSLLQYTVRVREDVPVGTVVLPLSARDPDLADGGRVVYSLDGGEEEQFLIDRDFGTIRLANPLDFEAKQVYNVTVRARDRGNPSLRSRAYVIVEVLDINENMHPPVFEDFVTSGKIHENLPVGSFVMQVSATDGDDKFKNDGKIAYSIRDGDGMGRFFIDQEGNIYTSEVLDRETSKRYWFTVFAQDRGAVPLHSHLHVYIEVQDENDNTPQTQEPVYYPSVAENSAPGTTVVKIEAYDLDQNPQRLQYRISGGNPQGFFVIDSDTGVITTTNRRLDRENQDEHTLEVTVSDNGRPPLSSTTRVVVTVTDQNDHSPHFAEQLYRVRVPEMPRHETDIPLFQVVAFDRDSGPNADIDYTIKSGKGNGRFKINAKTGMIYSQKNFSADLQYELQIQAEDNGRPRKSGKTRVILDVIELHPISSSPPVLQAIPQPIRVNENEVVGHLLTVVQAEDPDGDPLWYSIDDGNKDEVFMMNRETGEVVLVRPLDWETQNSYTLNVSATDGVYTVSMQLHITVIDYNDNRPQFSEKTYLIEISENIPVNTEIIQLQAWDRDEDKRVFFAIHSSTNPASMHKFHIDSSQGAIVTTEKLDREACHQHVLTVLVKDHGHPSHSNFARVVISVRDHNDYAPRFLADVLRGHVHETTALGTSVLQVVTVDRDKGKNSEVHYSIVSGNIGGTFSIDRTLGTISVAREIKLKSELEYEYTLIVKAMDHGDPPLSSIVTVNIEVTMADNAAPKFGKEVYSTEIHENLEEGSYVITVEAVSKSTVYYEIVSGNRANHFVINPNSGIVVINWPIDYEIMTFFNLTVQATNMVNQFAITYVLVHVLDVNDNAPYFLQETYTGNLTEAAAIGSVVMANSSTPLVISAKDADSELNALLVYEISDKTTQKYFTIDANTGAIRSISSLDHEEIKSFEFQVQVSDMGKPRLSAEVAARVVIHVEDVNDCTPVFEKDQYNVSVLLPTFKNVVVTTVKASDGDVDIPTVLKYDIVAGNVEDKFQIDATTGVITVKDDKNIQSRYTLTVRVSDGRFSSRCKVNVIVDKAIRSGLFFSQEKYFVNIMENKSDVITVAVVTVLGNSLDEHLHFQILNPSTMFTVGATSGVIRTVGIPFDREVRDTYTLIVEARSELEQHRIAQVAVYVSVMDVNDNSPIFINMPYYSVVPVDAKEGDIILKVQAIDKDIGDNGEVRYELSEGDKEFFRVNSKSGDLSLRRPLQEINKEFNLQIRAYDRGMEPRHTEATVVVRVISRSMPLFQQQYYSAAVPESMQPYSPVLSVHADSPEGRKLIYSVIAGNDHEEFAVDFNTEPDRKNNGPCVIYVVDQLDFETRHSYILTLQATDAVSGAHAEVLVSVAVEDVNDNAPEFAQTTYNVNVVETAPIGTVILELSTVDLDSGVNKLVQYTLRTEHGNASEYFHIHPTTGMVSIKAALDREQIPRHHFVVIASDSGVPALSTSTHVWVSIADVNDNPPRFEQPTYHCFLSELATRGQFVTMVTAFDPDPSDQAKLTYTIVGGNDQQCFTINPSLGMITLVSLHKFNQQFAYTLNVSASDGVYTAFTRVKVDILSSNRHAPQFERARYEVHFDENQPTGTLVTKLYAVDEDRGSYGHVKYNIQSDTSKLSFTIDPDTGEVHSKRILDRETQNTYEIPVVAVDDGGQSGYALLVVTVSDVNDNAPQFRLDEYRANIHANMTIGTTIVQVQATDSDYGMSATVEYSIYETNASETNTTDLFGINRETGEIYLKRSALTLENQVYQFFVRARDLGEPVLESEIPVDIFIIGPQDVPPRFSQRANQYFVHENAPIGTIITVLNARSNDTVSYSVVSQLDQVEGVEMFKVDDEGQMVVSGPLDRELRDVYSLTVRAETESSPPLTAFADITIQIMDENDNDPEFESNPYRVSVAENAAEGATVLKLVAHDQDLGHSSEVRYSLGPKTEHLVNVFAIDSGTGWVTTLVPLDREMISHYSFAVVATDNGNPPRSATTMVQVKVQDYNDNPPRFTQDDYRAAVNEEALLGTVVVTVSTTDADEELNSRVEYYITGGDPYGHFQIQHTGEIAVHKELDRENIPSYKLQVTATDGTYVSTANVFIEILDDNDNPPVCKKVKYTKKVQEGITVSSYILTVEASDRDEPHNARLKYILSGEGSSHFSLDKSSGGLKVAKPLDREKRARYQLTAHVQDKEHSNWECTSEVEIILSDVNDNAPEFTQDLYSVTVPEDTEVRTLVGKVHATDRDLGVNRKIKYSFVDSASGHFVIDDQSGLVSLAKALDREQRALFNLTIKATDQGVPQLSSLTHLLVVVLDINDNPPEFASRMYHSSVPESSPPGSDVIRVLATSRDSGINAEITYSIVGGNEHGKFTIHPKTGVITIMQALDYERARDYYLTVQANDGGTPSLSNHATVNITITDANDNAPIFGQLSYSAIVQEDAQVGDRILQVVATDLDSPPNSRIIYYVIKGDKLAQFGINKQSGYITVESPLDRETISKYQLEIQAMDSGIPNLSSTVLVNIEVSDANDNPPVFSTSNHTAFVQEDKPLGHNILKFVVSDADSAPNGGPFTFDIRAGNKGNEFHITHDGILRTATRFNHKIQEVYRLQVRVFDNGTPPLYSDTWVTVRVIEESRFQPVVAPLEVTVSSYLDEFPGGVLGQVKATDQDPYDKLSFALSPGYDHLFEIDSDDGTLVALAGLDVGHYVLNISVSDGKFTTYGMVNVDVSMVTEQMLEHALVIRLDSITPEDFIVTYRRGFLRAMRNILSVRAKDVEILSIQPVPQVRRPKRQIQQDLDVMFAVRRGHAGFYLAEHIRKALRDSKSTFEAAMEVQLVKIHDNLCTADRCVRGDCRDRLVLDEKLVISITTETLSYVSPQHHHRVECICREGFGGERCDTPINECARDPCPPFMVCVADSSTRGYSCQCPEGKGGPVCKETCADASCYEEKNPVSFRGKSYALYSLVNSMDKYFALSLRIRTGQSTGCLKYAAGRVDYSILEIVNGVVQYRFNCGSGEGIVRVEHVHINDGKWHEVHLNRYGNKAELIVDSKSSSQGSTPGHNDILNIESNDIYFGAEVHPHPTISGYEDLRMGFVGCMDDIRIDHIMLPLHVASGNSVAILRRFTNVEFQCILPPDLGMCGSQPCLNGGTCKANDNTYVCHCHARFMGTRCEIDTNPCASNPCLHGGTCANLHNDFHCSCAEGLSGKRCEFGRHCNPNPCRHGGVCEEGSHGPICKCRGFQGEHCQIDIDECLRNPCTNGGNCLNTVGSFVCKCGPNATGPLCDNLIPSSSITSSSMNITVEEIIGIVATVLAIILLALIFVIVKKVRAKRARQRRHDALLDLPKDIIVKNKTHDDLKRCSKLSNLEAHTTVALMLPPRPASYTPSRNEDSGTALNNFDTVRSYGSAADDLESIPKYNADFLQNITKNNTASMTQGHPPPPPPTQASDSESLHKPSWDLDHNLKESYPETKIHNDLKSSRPSVQTPSHQKKKTPLSSPHDAGRDAGNPSVSNFALDDSSAGSPQANSKGYHWDCSDWARSQNPLPNITEVPTNEVPDSPSLHSNESNSHVDASTPPLDLDSEYVGDSEYNENEFELEEGKRPTPFDQLLALNNIDYADEGESYSLPRHNYQLHPNQYLPTYSVTTDTETEENGNLLQIEDEPPPYSLHPKGGGELLPPTLDDMSVSLGGYTSTNASCSDLSENLCEIEDSEVCSEPEAEDHTAKRPGRPSSGVKTVSTRV